MTCNDTIRMAREVLDRMPPDSHCRESYWTATDKELVTFADLVRADERKRLHDKFMEIHKSQQHSNNYWHFAARKIMEES